MSAALCTIGYEGRSVEELIGLLRDARVERLVDVRELPSSHKRGFSKTALSQALGDAGIEYAHARALGLRKELRDRWKAGDVAGAAKVFRRQLAREARPALQALADGLDDRRTCLMCFERDHARCHRKLVVEALQELEPDLTVRHL